MSKTTSIPTTGVTFYRILLSLYPVSYSKKFGSEMIVTFLDFYQDQVTDGGEMPFLFWASILSDTCISAFWQHIALFRKQGAKKYLQENFYVNTFNIIGVILLFPAVVMFLTDFISRILQGDLTHYNRPVYHFLSHTPLYWYPVLFTWVILFPVLAVAINLIPLAMNIRKSKSKLLPSIFTRRNTISMLLFGIGSFFLAVVKLHDFAPCMVHGLLRLGINQLPHIFSVCRNA